MYRFTGHPFVDAGIAGMCAAAEVSNPSELDAAAIRRAVGVLLKIMTGESAFKVRIVGKKKSVFATSEMSVIFPNGPHANPSGKPTEKAQRYAKRIAEKRDALLGNSRLLEDSCFVDGGMAQFRVGNDEFPLVDSKSKRNFHPGHQEGHSVSAATALALEFFPLSVLRTGTDEGLFWFVHTDDAAIAVACAALTLKRMNELISRREGLGFFGDWKVAARTPAAAFIALIRNIVTPGGRGLLKQEQIKRSDAPITAYVFSNDNRSPSISAQDLPHELFRYFSMLRGSDKGAERFQREVLENEQACWRVTTSMLRRARIIRTCCIAGSKDKPPFLRGGWEAHSLYATEVQGMSDRFIRAIEDVSKRIVEHEKKEKAVFALRGREADKTPATVLLRLVYWELMTSDQYQILVPPTDYYLSFAARDYLLAAIFERENAAAYGRPFQEWQGATKQTAEEKHPLLLLIEQIGANLIEGGRGRRAISDLGKATRLIGLRGVFVDFVRRGFASYNDFVYLFPPTVGEYIPGFAARDYLLAYLYDRLRGLELPEAEPLSTPEGVAL